MALDLFNESHEMFRDSVRKFIAREIAPHVDHWEEEETFPRELYKKAADAGFLGLGYPEELGGTPVDFLYVIVFTEEMMKCGSVGLSSTLGCSAIAVPPILYFGNEEQKKKYIPPVLAGEQIAVLGVTEQSGGSDVANLRTRAERKGDHYIVNGSKTFITGGTRADYVTTAVRTGGPGHAGISALIIPTSTPGFSVSRKIEKMGWKAIGYGRAFL